MYYDDGATNCDFTVTTGGDGNWFSQTSAIVSYYDNDAPQSGNVSHDEEAWMQTTVTASAGDKATFYWRTSSESSDYLKFYIDDQYQDQISGEVDWTQKSYTVSSGIHTLKWRYISGGGDSGDNCGWVDYVQWTGSFPRTSAK